LRVNKLKKARIERVDKKMRFFTKFLSLASLCLCLLVNIAFASDLPSIAPPAAVENYNKPFINEIRAGHFAHNVYPGFIPNSLEKFEFTRWENVNAEILFRPIDWVGEKWLGTLRPHIGATVNFNNRENMAYAGFATTKHLFDSPVFLEASFGLAIHDGYLSNPPVGSGLRRLGCRVQFHESFSLGYDITEKMNVMATYEHMSNADLCEFNSGLSNAGIRMGYKF